MPRLALAIALLLPCIPASAADLDDVIGGWVGSGLSCNVLEDYSSEIMMVISSDRISGYESDCAIRDTRVSRDTLSIDMICEGEGETYRNTMDITIISRDRISTSGDVDYDRCY